MNSKVKKILAVLLSAAMVMSMTFVSTAASLRYERPELNKADTVKTTGTWSKDDKGFWSLTVENRKVTDGWYYANMQNSSTEYGWFHFGANGAMSTGWVNDKKNPSIWYYMGETKDKTEGSLTTGWVTDPRDGKKYYMDPGNGQMSRGWKVINGVWYYFSDATREGHPDGSMYKNEKTPDGYYVGTTGAWRQSSGSSSSGGGRPTPTPTPTPTRDPIMTATASTTTPQYAGKAFNTDGLTITVFKNGVAYKTVRLPDSSISAEGIKVTVNNTENGNLSSGPNAVKIEFVYSDPDVIIGKSITTDVFTVEGKHAFSVGSGKTVEFSPGLLYWDGSAFKFEENQYGFEGTWNASHVNHFYWSEDASKAYKQTYDSTGATPDDKFFASSLNVDGKAWRTLTDEEWYYLLGDSEERTGKRKTGVTVCGKTNCLVIAPDNFSGEIADIYIQLRGQRPRRPVLCAFRLRATAAVRV